MSKTILLGACAFLSLSLSAGSVLAGHGGSGAVRGCSDATLKGSYLTSAYVLRIDNPSDGPVDGAAIAMQYYDGRGTVFTRATTMSVPDPQYAEFTYSIDPDCHGTLSYQGEVIDSLEVSPEGDIAVGLQNQPQVASLTRYERVSSQNLVDTPNP